MAFPFPSTAVAPAPAPARLLLVQPTGGAAGGRALLLQGLGAAAAAGRALVAVARLPRCTAGDESKATEEALAAAMEEALAAAMEEARLSFGSTAVYIDGDKALVDHVSATVVISRDLLAAMAKGPLDPLVFKEVEGLAVIFADVESACQAGWVSADGLLGAMDGLRVLAQTLLGPEAAVGLRPCGARPTGPLSAQEDKADLLWDLAQEFAVVVEDVRCAARRVPVLHAGAVIPHTRRQFLVVQGNKELLQHLIDTCHDSEALLARLVANTVGGPFSLDDAVFFNEVVGIGKAFVKVEVECSQGYARADSVVAAMDALKTMTAVFAGTAVAAGLRPYSPWPAVHISGEDDTISYLWNLAAAFGVLMHDVKFRCGHYYE